MISLLLGLGNIGRKYNNTRHNIGFDVLDRLVYLLTKKNQTEPVRKKAELYDIVQVNNFGRQLALAWPRTFMNRSGLAAQELLEKMNLTPEQMLVIVDDFNLPLGKLRLRRSGGDGGHNGLESIIEMLGTKNFPRLRLGIGPVPDNVSTIDFVLGRFETEEEASRKEILDNAAKTVLYILNNCFDEAMSKFNADPA
ncbi:MAG: aminoacyl-tRNA hydrolase [Candidatus Zixiibacteriota bacterium]|nr:MAG: aminoacyl-tRNA hydrolase [candidate division Zixibacteria bacterium]